MAFSPQSALSIVTKYRWRRGKLKRPRYSEFQKTRILSVGSQVPAPADAAAAAAVAADATMTEAATAPVTAQSHAGDGTPRVRARLFCLFV